MIVNKIDFIVDVLQQLAHFQRFFCKHNIVDKRCVAYQSAIFEFEQNAQKIFAVGEGRNGNVGPANLFQNAANKVEQVYFVRQNQLLKTAIYFVDNFNHSMPHSLSLATDSSLKTT